MKPFQSERIHNLALLEIPMKPVSRAVRPGLGEETENAAPRIHGEGQRSNCYLGTNCEEWMVSERMLSPLGMCDTLRRR